MINITDTNLETDEFKRLLQDSDDQVRLNAAVRLAYEGCADGLDVLIGGLSHESRNIRFSQVPDALALLGDRAHERLRHAPIVQKARIPTARALSLLGDTRGIGEVLTEALATEDSDEQWMAVYLSGETGPDAISALPSLKRLAAQGNPLAYSALAVVGQTAGLKDLLEALDHPDSNVKYHAMRAISGLGANARTALPRLQSALTDETRSLSERLAAAHALRCVAPPGPEAADIICGTLERANRWFRIGLLRELAKMCPRYAARKADQIVEWPRWEARWAHGVAGDAGDALTNGILPTFVNGLNDLDYDVKRNSMLGLAMFGTLPPGIENAIEQASGLCEQLRMDVLKRVDKRTDTSAKCSCDMALYEPDVDLDAFADRCERAWSTGSTHLDSTVSKWIFLKYLVDRHGLMLHGSRVADIDILKPVSKSGGGNRTADQPGVFAVDHTSMAMYFGIVDRTRTSSLQNGLYETPGPDGITRRYFHLATTMVGLSQRPFIDATVYVLPRETFSFMGEWTSLVPVTPLASVAVTPSDFPFLESLWGSDLGPLSTQFDPKSEHLYDLGFWASKRSELSAHIHATPTPWTL